MPIASALILIDAFSVHAPGGARRVFLETARLLVERGIRVDVVCRRLHPEDPVELQGIRFHYYNDTPGSALRKARHYRNEIRRLVGHAVATARPDVLIFHSSSAALGLNGLPILARIPRFYYFHSPWNVEYDLMSRRSALHPWQPSWFTVAALSEIRKNMDRRYLRFSNGIVVLSGYMRDELLAQHPEMDARPTAVIPGGVDPVRFFPAALPTGKTALRQRFGLPEDALILLAARNLAPRTGVDTLLRAFARIRADQPRPRRFLALLGDGPRRRDYERLAASLGLGPEAIRFTGYVAEDDLSDWYRSADLSVMPTRALEGFGLATVEAMACGTPVIGTDIGATPELLAKIDPRLVVHGCRPDALANKIAEFNDRDALFELGQRAAAITHTEWTWARHSAHLLEFIRDVNVCRT
jgi:glycosyltransferase involved in cell wall biosynthesis